MGKGCIRLKCDLEAVLAYHGIYKLYYILRICKRKHSRIIKKLKKNTELKGYYKRYAVFMCETQ